MIRAAWLGAGPQVGKPVNNRPAASRSTAAAGEENSMSILCQSKYALGVLALLAPAAARAAVTTLDLTATNVSGQVIVGDAIFQRTDMQPTGTGVIDSFVRIQ